MTDREKMEIIIKAKGDCSHMSIENYFSCGSCPIEKECNNTSIPTCGRSLRLAKEWIIEDDKKEKGMKKFKIEDYKYHTAMFCKTEEEYDAFRAYLESIDKPFMYDEFVKEYVWKDYFKTGIIFYLDQLCWDNLETCQKDFTIIKYSDFDWSIAPPFPYNLQKGDKILVGLVNHYTKEPHVFLNYRPELEQPFECLTNTPKNIENYNNSKPYKVSHYKIAKPLPKYKAYTKPKMDWVENGLEIRLKLNHDVVYRISGFLVNFGLWYLIFDGFTDNRELKDCFNDLELTDGTPFGELINDK